MEKAKQAFGRLQSAVNALTAVILVAIMVIILVQTFTRYVIFYSIPWSEEASRYLFVAMILLGINIGISQNLMVRIDIIDNFLPSGVKKAFEIGRQVFSIGYIRCVFLQHVWHAPHWRIPDESGYEDSHECYVRDFVSWIRTCDDLCSL